MAAVIYLKSVLALIVSAVGALLIMVLVAFIYALSAKPATGEATGWDPISLVSLGRSPIVWLIALIIFVAGFYWEFSRLSR